MRRPEPPQERGRSTRQRILESAARLYAKLPPGQVSVAAIADAAQAYPNQITYYFGSKDVLFVHAAFLGLLHDAERIESVGFTVSSPAAFASGIARTVLALPSIANVVRALAVSSARPELSAVVDHHLRLLFRQSERYLAELLERRGWVTDRAVAAEVRTFWSAALGATLLSQAGALGTPADLDLAGTISVRAVR